MPLLLLVPVAVGGGIWLTGEGVDKTSNGALKIAVAGAVLGSVYLIMKKKGVI